MAFSCLSAAATSPVAPRMIAFPLVPAVSPSVHARSARVGIEKREISRDWGQQLVVRGQLHSPTGQLVMRVLLPFRPNEDTVLQLERHASIHVVLELEHVGSRSTRGPRHAKRTQFCLPSRVCGPASSDAASRHDSSQARRAARQVLFVTSSRGETRLLSSQYNRHTGRPRLVRAVLYLST